MPKLKTLLRNKTLLTLLSILFVSLLANVYLLLKPAPKGDPGSPQSPPASSPEKEVLVLRVIDGDNFHIEGDTTIRLAGASSPEKSECLGLAAKERLHELVVGKKITLEKVTEDNFGRMVAFAFHNTLFIDETLVEEGYATAASIDNPRYGPRLASAQERAKSAERGIWSSVCQRPRGQNCVIKGNYRRDKDTRIYHTPDCYNYEKITVRESAGDRWFCSEQEATSAGFRKSLDCPATSPSNP